jgi:Uma2 family endonuclease
MTQAKLKFSSFGEYLSWSDDPANHMEGYYELIDGELVRLMSESGLNVTIATDVLLQLVAIGVPFNLIKTHACEVQVPVLQSGDAANRYPDLVVLREAHLSLTQRRLTITLDRPPPVMAIEVTSPGKRNRERDYNHKLAQYETVGISTYWIIDPKAQSVTVFQLQPSGYQKVGEFRSDDGVECPSFPALNLTASQILRAGNP